MKDDIIDAGKNTLYIVRTINEREKEQRKEKGNQSCVLYIEKIEKNNSNLFVFLYITIRWWQRVISSSIYIFCFWTFYKLNLFALLIKLKKTIRTFRIFI